MLPFESQVVLALLAAFLGAGAAAYFLLSGGGAVVRRGLGANRLLVPALAIALAGRVASAGELLAVVGLTVGFALAGDLGGPLLTEFLFSGAAELVVAYGLLGLIWGRLYWREVPGTTFLSGGGRTALFLAAGLWLTWLVRVPIDFAATAMQTRDFATLLTGPAPDAPFLNLTGLLVGSVWLLIALVVAYGVAAYLAGRNLPRLDRVLAPARRTWWSRAVVWAATVGLLADGLYLTAAKVSSVIVGISADAYRAEAAFALLALVTAYPVAFLAARSVDVSRFADMGLVPAAPIKLILTLTLAAYLSWPVELAARLWGMEFGLPSAHRIAVVVLVVAGGAFLLVAVREGEEA